MLLISVNLYGKEKRGKPRKKTPEDLINGTYKVSELTGNTKDLKR